MKKRTILFSLLLSSGVVALLTASALACSCIHSSPCKEFGRAKLIFVGRMIEGSEKIWAGKDKRGIEVFYEAGMVRFAVDEVFKGDRVSEIILTVSSNKNTSCEYSMARGEKYLVYAYERDGKLATGVCTRTVLVSDGQTKEDLEFLRNPPVPGSGGKLSGRIWSAEGGAAKPMADVKVNVTGEGKRSLDTTTDQEGEFQLAGLQPGKYKVEPVWPKHYANYYPNKEIEIFDQSCSEVGFEAKIDGRVEGRTLDAKGRPASVTIYLEPVEPKTIFDAQLGISDEDGNFEINGMPPGRYLLYFTLRSGNSEKEKKYFYPGTWNRGEATVIDLPIGQRLSGYEFQPPPNFLVRTLEGKVTWADGSPAANVEVLLLCPRNAHPGGYVLEFGAVQTKTDETGHFKLQGFAGNIYWLEARGGNLSLEDAGKGGSHSPSRRLLLQKDLSNLNLVLSSPGFFGKGCK
ncbi:MAG: carboxypeptidase regulatory-like domain-containing protein [Acidobacteriota bacterium]|nr:carboxypeptidase regulatory-like domain-containing protein [Acidobacteriota bacterium]